MVNVGVVVGVTDGDTISILIDGVTYRLRLIGIDCPESGQSFFYDSAAHMSKLVEGKTVVLVRDISDTDNYGRLLRYVIAGNTFVNYQIVIDGYAYTDTYPPDVACSSTFTEAQASAKMSKVGLWIPTPTLRPTSAVAPLSSQGENCHPSYPDVCIKPPPPDLDCKDVSYR